MASWLYLIVPLALLGIALFGVAVIVGRKWAFLRKLDPEAHVLGDTLVHDYAPEVVDWWRGIDWAEYKRVTLVELEKLLRRGRLMMSSVDRVTERMVRSVRRVHQETAQQQEQQAIQQEAAQQAAATAEEEEEIGDPEDVLKQQEQDLIVQIAQSPKDATLYEKLARVYMGLKNWSDAKEALQAALRLDPENTNLQKRLESVERRIERSTAA